MRARWTRAGWTLLGLAAATVVLLASPRAMAAPPWVDRHLTLPAGAWAFDMGLGLGFAPGPPEAVGAGINLEAAVGLTDRVELGLRTGLRLGDAGDRALEPDNYGRLFDREYVAGRDDVRNRVFPGKEHSPYTIPEAEAHRFLERLETEVDAERRAVGSVPSEAAAAATAATDDSTKLYAGGAQTAAGKR